VVNALLHSRLPIFQGLTPKVVADVRDDDTFVDFREKLHEVYRSVPGFGPDADFDRHLAQSEEAALGPVLQQAEREAKRGFLARLGVGLAESVLSIGARVLYDSQTGQLGWTTAGPEVVGILADRVKFSRTRDPLTTWTRLYRHQRSVGYELQLTERQAGSNPQGQPWTIADEPSMTVHVTPGIALRDEAAALNPDEVTGYVLIEAIARPEVGKILE
jgi:hypothetical protein